MESRLVLGPRIAEGGMAEVFAARLLGSEGFAKDVVVKRVLPQLARDADFIARFLDEARLAAQLSHPGIVQVLQLVADGDELMMVMEAVDGADLSTVLKALRVEGRTLSLPLTLRVASAVAGALAYAHEKRDRKNKPLGVIHRDVTPSNILVSRDGATKLIDFGIARATSVARLTRRGSIVGKVHYMAPEQVRDLELDARVDVWAVGVVLFQMLTARRPFAGDKDTEIFQRIATGDRPDVRALCEVPESLARVVDACLMVDRDARIGSARALAQALDDVIAGEGLYASANDLGDLVTALVPPPIELTAVRADGASRTASAAASVAVSIPEVDAQLDVELAAPLALPFPFDDAQAQRIDVHADTTPARKHQQLTPTVVTAPTSPMAPSLTLDSAETTFVCDIDAITRLNTLDADAITARRAAVDELETETLKRLPRAAGGNGADGALTIATVARVATLTTATTASAVAPMRSRPPSRHSRAVRFAAAGAAAFIAVAALGAWSALAGAFLVDDDTSTRAARPSPIAPIAPVATVATVAPGAAIAPTPAPAIAPIAPTATPVRPATKAPAATAATSRSKKPVAPARAELESGTLVVDSRPWSSVTIDGVEVGVTPIAPRDVRPGAHTIVFENEAQGLTKKLTVVVKSGRVTTARVDLRR